MKKSIGKKFLAVFLSATLLAIGVSAQITTNTKIASGDKYELAFDLPDKHGGL